MRRSEKQAGIENEAHGKLKAKKIPSSNSFSNIVTLDSDTMVEVFKYLNYCQLANSSLVANRFRNLICAHRHKLALLYVHGLYMNELNDDLAYIKIYNKALSPEAYNEWVICNNFSKRVPLEGQTAGKQSTEHDRKFYMLDAIYGDAKRSYSTKRIFEACAELKNENWPVFQHFVCLLTDPNIYIRSLELSPQNDVFNLLAGAMNLDRVRCKVLDVKLGDSMQRFIDWIKDHVLCNEFRIHDCSNSKCDEEFLDFFMTGANCTPEIYVGNYDLCKVVVVFVQIFMDLKNCDGNQLVGLIHGNVSSRSVKEVKRSFAEFIVKEENDYDFTELVFEFVNNNIGKKIQLSLTIILGYHKSEFSLEIASL